MKFSAFRRWVNNRRAREVRGLSVPWKWLSVERLEDRITPTVTAFVFNNILQIEPAFGNNTIRLEIDPADHSQLEVLVAPNPVSPALFPLSSFTQIHVHAGTGSDTLIVDETNGNFVPSQGVQWDGGDPGASDTLQIVDNTANTWNITSPNAGTLNGNITFTNVSNLIGGGTSNTLNYAAGASISGTISGGSVPLTIDDPLGTLQILGTVTDQGGPVTLSGANVDIDGNILTYGGALTVSTPGDITVDPAPATVIVSTRDIAVGADPATAPSIGNSGNIAMTGTNITLGTGTSSAALYSQVQPGSTFTPGSITLAVSQDGGEGNGSGFTLPPVLHISTSTATITLNNAIVDGGVVTFTSEATNLEIDTAAPTSDTPTVVDTAIDFLKDITLIAGVSVATSTSTINLSAASSITGSSFTATTAATSDAEVEPIGIKIGVAIGVDNTTSTISVAGSINTTGDTFIQSNAVNTLSVKSDAGGNLAGAGASIAVAVANSTSSAVVAPTANLNVGGNLTDQATTTNNKAVLAASTTGDDGNVGIAIAIAYENDPTTALLGGTVTVGGNALVQAGEIKNGVAGTKFFFLPTNFAAVTAASGVGTDDKGDLLTDMQGDLTTGLITQVTNLVGQDGKADQKMAAEAPAFEVGALRLGRYGDKQYHGRHNRQRRCSRGR